MAGRPSPAIFPVAAGSESACGSAADREALPLSANHAVVDKLRHGKRICNAYNNAWNMRSGKDFLTAAKWVAGRLMHESRAERRFEYNRKFGDRRGHG